ncbi:MAG: CvpA family protein [Rhizomicrobium sp.]
MSLAFSFVDLLVVLVILGSAAYAAWRGFVSETLGIVAWAAAAFASLYLGPWVARLAHSLIATDWIATVAGYAIVFVAVFIPIQFASHRFSEGVKRSPVGPLDRVLGATFGIVRGLAILGIAYLVFTAFVPIHSQPYWLTGARSLPMIQSSAEVLLALVPDRDRREPVAPSSGPKPTSIDDLLRAPAHVAHPVHPAAKPDGRKKHKKGYGAQDRHALDRLFEATGSNGSGSR